MIWSIRTEAAIAAPSSTPKSLGHGHLIKSRVARTTAEKQKHNAAVMVTFGPWCLASSWFAWLTSGSFGNFAILEWKSKMAEVSSGVEDWKT
jgi:hypothetical protein